MCLFIYLFIYFFLCVCDLVTTNMSWNQEYQSTLFIRNCCVYTNLCVFFLFPHQQPIRQIGSNHNTTARPFPGFSGSQPKYSLGAPPFLSTSKDGPDGSISSTSSRSTSGSTSPSSGMPVAGTNIALNKENAKNFLMMTLDKENVNTINSNSKTNKNNNTLFSSQFLNNNGAVGGTVGHQRKYSLGSNASSCSSNDTDHDALTRRNNEVRYWRNHFIGLVVVFSSITLHSSHVF